MTTQKPKRRTQQYSVHLSPEVYDYTSEMADEDEVAMGNWSRFVELVLRAVMKRGKR